MKLLRVENGMCRAYYQAAGRLYCYQEGRKGQYVLFVCTKDGEPSYQGAAKVVAESQVPTGSDYTSTHLAKWLEQEGLVYHEGART